MYVCAYQHHGLCRRKILGSCTCVCTCVPTVTCKLLILHGFTAVGLNAYI